ncbi:flagellin [Paludibaculum fermentans]|uniref:flagellin N-terminal helical domain-containing protein n=1 Tax=Paludibaculum fermentans TaxID=1473598 RepID=UPI003EBDD2F6
MIRSIDGSTDLYLERLRQINARMAKAQSEVSGGKRVESASDDPAVIANLMQVRTDLARLNQVSTNLDRVQSEVDSAEGAMQNAVRVFDEVRTLGLSAANSEQTAVSRASVAEQVGTLMQRMVALANTQVGGRFIFSGDNDQGAAYGLDLQQNPPWTSYQGSDSSRQVAHPNGGMIPVARDARMILDNSDPAKNVFQAMENLRQALLANDADAIQASLAPLPGVSDHLNSSLSFYGNVQSRLEDAVNTSSKEQVRLKEDRGRLEDADQTQAILDFTQLKYSQQAALEVRSKMGKTSLFDYMG